ncbi:MAG: hypothetical protein H4O13_04415 [Xanthomonadales bacterium]|nr:hypothetical protein [Xanthomonadales bacterium]
MGSAEVQLGDKVFEAGGHSLLALTRATRIENSLGVKLSLLAIAQSSLAALAAQIESAEQGAPVAAEAQPSPRSRARVARLFGLARRSAEGMPPGAARHGLFSVWRGRAE